LDYSLLRRHGGLRATESRLSGVILLLFGYDFEVLVDGFPNQAGCERGIEQLAGNQIVLRRGSGHLGALALNWNRKPDAGD
jgi:hypothetical protein